MAEARLGEPAPDLSLLDPQDQEVRLSSFWAEGPLVAIFLRHFG